MILYIFIYKPLLRILLYQLSVGVHILTYYHYCMLLAGKALVRAGIGPLGLFDDDYGEYCIIYHLVKTISLIRGHGVSVVSDYADKMLA